MTGSTTKKSKTSFEIAPEANRLVITSPTTQIQGKSVYFRNHLKEQYLEYNQLFIDIRLTLISHIGWRVWGACVRVCPP